MKQFNCDMKAQPFDMKEMNKPRVIRMKSSIKGLRKFQLLHVYLLHTE